VTMLAAVLQSPRAVQVSIEFVRAFVRLRAMLAGSAELARKLAAPEKRADRSFIQKQGLYGGRPPQSRPCATGSPLGYEFPPGPPSPYTSRPTRRLRRICPPDRINPTLSYAPRSRTTRLP
jgi:hypothetical protein